MQTVVQFPFLELALIDWREQRPRALPPDRPDQLAEIGGGSDLVATEHPCLPGAVERDDDGRFRDGVDEGNHAGHPPQRPVKAQLTEERHSLHLTGAEHLTGHEEGDGHRKIQTGSALAQARWGQVHRDAPVLPRQVAGGERGPYPVTRLTAREVGKTDDVETRQPIGHLNLDGDRATLDAEQRGRRNGGEHPRPPVVL